MRSDQADPNKVVIYSNSDWHGSVSWALCHKKKKVAGPFQSGRMTGLQVWSLVRALMEGN